MNNANHNLCIYIYIINIISNNIYLSFSYYEIKLQILYNYCLQYLLSLFKSEMQELLLLLDRAILSSVVQDLLLIHTP